MSFDINEHLPEDFAGESRVWIYQANRLFTMAEALDMEPKLQAFVESWKSHGDPVKGFANLFFGRFLVLIADETATGVSGCSTDSSVRLVKQLEQIYGADFFDRQQLAFYRNNKVEVIPMSQLGYAAEHGLIHADTLYFDNTVQTLDSLRREWIKPAKNSWIQKRFALNDLAASSE